MSVAIGETPTAKEIAGWVDRIGLLKAELAPKEKELKALQDALKAMGPGPYAGRLFDAMVFEQERRVLDTAALRALLPPAVIEQYSKTSHALILKLTARKTQ